MKKFDGRVEMVFLSNCEKINIACYGDFRLSGY